MPESTDLIRRLDAAANSKSLHPNYARELLREARDALTPAEEPPEQVVLNAWCLSRFGAAPSHPRNTDEPT